MEDTNDISRELISWDFYEFYHQDRGNLWYIGFGVLAAVGVIYGIFTDNFLFSLIILLSGLIIFLQNWKKPSRLKFAISPQGITIGANFYPMKDIDEFWMIYEPPKVKKLYINFKASWRPLTGINLEEVNPLRVREILLDYLPENLDMEEEPLSDTIARMLNL